MLKIIRVEAIKIRVNDIEVSQLSVQSHDPVSLAYSDLLSREAEPIELSE